MKNFNELVPTSKIELDIGEVNKDRLEYFIYNKLFDDCIKRYIPLHNKEKKYNVLNIYYGKTCLKDFFDNIFNINYKDINILDGNINKINYEDNFYDYIFAQGDRIAYGKNHQSLFEIERILKQNGYLICAVSKFWYNIGFNQMLFCYRNWKYLEAIEINYNFNDIINGKKNSITTNKYFLVYKNIK